MKEEGVERMKDWKGETNLKMMKRTVFKENRKGQRKAK